jgi:hypothetical protein
LGISESQLTGAAQGAAEALSRDSVLADLKPGSSPLFRSLTEWAQGESAQSDNQAGASDVPAALSEATLSSPAGPGLEQTDSAATRQAVLAAGIQDITNTLAGNFQLNDVLRMILETMYRAVGFSRVLLCIRDPSQQALRARFGFGADVDQIIKRGFNVPLAPTRDAFYAALGQGADIYIDDVDGATIRDHIPAWYRSLVPARSLLLFPILIKDKPVGLLYADSDSPGAIHLGSSELSLLKTLRNQAILALKQIG